MLQTLDHKVPGSNPCLRNNSTHDFTALHCTEPFIITHHLSMTNKFEGDIKHQITIILKELPVVLS